MQHSQWYVKFDTKYLNSLLL